VRITAVKAFPLRFAHRDLFIIKVETDSGLYGVGEGGISGRELAMAGMAEHLGRLLLGADPRRIEHLWQTLYRGAYFEGGKILGAVVSAIDMALWDILGKSLDVPVYQLLGGACREHVPCFATAGSLTGPECVQQARDLAAAGWRCLRFGPGMPGADWVAGDGALYEPLESLTLAARWLSAVRAEVGPDLALAVDFHHRLSVAEAALFCELARDARLLFLEEPIRAQSPAAYQQLRAQTALPFAIGEEFSSKWDFAPFLDAGLLNYARIDVCNVGGLTEAKKVASWCEARYIDVLPHNPLGPVCTAASIHLAAALPNFAMLEHWEWQTEATLAARDLFPVAPVIDGQHFALPTVPGLGVEFDEAAAADYPFEPWEPPHWRRRDGSYTNW
jgi:galactonate dehydratase